MREIVLSLAVFACLVAASLGCLFTYERLHDKYRHDNTANVVRLIANLFVVTTSLVLGLMINSAKNTFESIDHNVHSFGTELILFDRALRQYGPETTEVREILLSYLNRTLGGGAAATGEWGKRDAAQGACLIRQRRASSTSRLRMNDTPPSWPTRSSI